MTLMRMTLTLPLAHLLTLGLLSLPYLPTQPTKNQESSLAIFWRCVSIFLFQTSMPKSTIYQSIFETPNLSPMQCTIIISNQPAPFPLLCIDSSSDYATVHHGITVFHPPLGSSTFSSSVSQINPGPCWGIQTPRGYTQSCCSSYGSL